MINRAAVLAGPSEIVLEERPVPEHQGSGDNVTADPAMLVVVHVRAADPDRRDVDQHLTRPGPRRRAFLQLHPPGAVQDRDPHQGQTWILRPTPARNCSSAAGYSSSGSR